MTKITKNAVIKVVIAFLIGILALCLSGTVITSTTAQDSIITDVKITIDFSPYEDKFPNGVKNKYYRVFDASAKDNLGNDVVVDYVVTNPDGQVVLVSDGKFKTETVGEYIITYKAQSGVIEDVEIVKINVVESCEQLDYEISSDIESNGTTGQIFKLYNGTVKGGSGNIDIKMTLTIEDKEVNVYESTAFSYFVPTIQGEYTLKYQLSDFVENTKEVTKVISILDSDKPIMKTPSVSKINKVGETVKLPLVDAILYEDGKSYFVPVKVFYDDTEITSTMLYQAGEKGTHTVKYVAENVFDTTQNEEIIINVESVEQSVLYIADYFALDNFDGSYPGNADGYLLTSKENVNEAAFQFKSKIHKDFMNFEFKLSSLNAAFDTIEITLTDSLKGDDKVTIEYSNEKTMKIKNQGLVCCQSESTLSDEVKNGIYLKYDNKNETLVDASGNVLLNISVFDDGRSFYGFSSEYVYISCKVKGITEQIVLSIKNISGNSISDASSDLIRPMFCSADDFSGSVSADLGETVILKCPKAFDLLNDDKVTYRIEITYRPTNTTIYKGKINGTYELLIENSGEYRVLFFANDGYQEQRLNMTIHVEDRISPELNVEVPAISAKVGDTINLPEAVYSDNISENDKCMYFIYVAFGDFLKDTVYDHTYTFKEAGEYVFTYSVWDEAGNNTTAKFVVNCREG